MQGKNYEKELPEGYSEVLVIDAQDKKMMVRMNAAALLIMAVIIGSSFWILRRQLRIEDYSSLQSTIFLVILMGYVILHELVHGFVYKQQTGEKLTFGLTLSVAYCGVPNIYVYRKTALLALLAPFVVFTLIFTPLIFLMPDPFSKFYMTVLLGLHVGGCAGDLYDTFVYLTKLKDPKTLMKDTGPKQVFFQRMDTGASKILEKGKEY